MRINDNDKKMLRILYKFPYAPADIIALLIDEPLAYVTRRLLRFAEEKQIAREYFEAGKLSLNYLKTKGMRTLELPSRHITKPQHYTYRHTIAEVEMYTFLALWPKSGVKLGQIMSERDILNSVVWDVTGYNSIGRKTVQARDLSLGIHRPDGYIITEKNGEPRFWALEYERSKKNKGSNTQMIDSLESNSDLFSLQLWFCENENVRKKLEREKRDNHNVKIFDMKTIRKYLEARKQKLPEVLSTKENRKPRDFLGEFLEPIPLTDLPRKRKLLLE